jgi:hypothetical protein
MEKERQLKAEKEIQELLKKELELEKKDEERN